MGRKKLEIKPIKEKSSRQVAFCKRRKGLLKKANELSILCDVDVAAVVISNRGKLHQFSSSSTHSLTGILQRYESHAEKEMARDMEESKYSRLMTMGELLQTIERQLAETDVDGLTVTDLVHLENQLQTAIIHTRSRKTHLMLEAVKILHEKEKLLREENNLLENEIAKKKREVDEMVTNLPPLNLICGSQWRATLNLLE